MDVSRLRCARSSALRAANERVKDVDSGGAAARRASTVDARRAVREGRIQIWTGEGRGRKTSRGIDRASVVASEGDLHGIWAGTRLIAVLSSSEASEATIDSNAIACVRRRPCDAKVAGWERGGSVPCRAARVLTSASLPAPRPLSLFSVPSVAWFAGVCDAFARSVVPRAPRVLLSSSRRRTSKKERRGGIRRAICAGLAFRPVQAASFLSWCGRASEQEQTRHAYAYVARRSPPAAPCHLRRRRRRCQSPRLPPHMDMDVDMDIAMCRVVPRDAQSAKKEKGVN